MSAGMAEVIAAHSGHSVKLSPQGTFTVQCHGCGRSTSVHAQGKLPRSGAPMHAAHVAEELAKAGYGDVQEARVDALREAAEDMDERGHFFPIQWLNQRADAMEAPHGVD